MFLKNFAGICACVCLCVSVLKSGWGGGRALLSGVRAVTTFKITFLGGTGGVGWSNTSSKSKA